MSTNTIQFYSNLAPNEIPLSDLLIQDDLFYEIPKNWHVIITDIKNSTIAVAEGLHETVNLIATGSIVTVLNIAYKANISVPFFFGGDGATFIVPPTIIEPVMSALSLYHENMLENFDLDLRAGTVPVLHIYAQGHQLKISKFKSSATLSIPIVLGNGLAFAERIIKAKDYEFLANQAVEPDLDLTGMECRWDKISPPADHHEVVTLLAIAEEGATQADAFRKVILLLDDIYGTPEKRQPISVSKLQLKTTFNRIELEMRAKLEGANIFKRCYTWFTHFLAHLYFHTQKGKDYLNRLVNMSDTLVIDGRINTVISGTTHQRVKLQNALNDLEQQGEIKFGLWVSSASVMSCYVRDLLDDHIHFVDGAEGGYTKAATSLKLKMQKIQE